MGWFGAAKQEVKPVGLLRCSFCGVSQQEVRKLIAGPSVYICDRCVELCVDILREPEPGMPAASLPPPPLPELLAALEQRCVGLDAAKLALARTLALHHARLRPPAPPVRIPVVLLAGPTGSGKTTLLRALLGATALPGYLGDVTRLSATGYVGLEVENFLQELVRVAGGDRTRAEQGILALDGLHRLARRTPPPGAPRDITGECVQRELLRVLEGLPTDTTATGPRHPQAPTEPFRCDRLLVVLAATLPLPEGWSGDEQELRDRLLELGLLEELLARIDWVAVTLPPDRPTLSRILTAHLLPEHAAARELLQRPDPTPAEQEQLVIEALAAGNGAWGLRHALLRRLLG